jgi:hypothetical protein
MPSGSPRKSGMIIIEQNTSALVYTYSVNTSDKNINTIEINPLKIWKG